MTKFVSCGVRIDGKRPKSKAEINRVLADEILCDSVSFDVTDAFGSAAGNTLWVQDLPGFLAHGHTINIVGPDPYTKRNFYGTVSVTKSGAIKIK